LTHVGVSLPLVCRRWFFVVAGVSPLVFQCRCLTHTLSQFDPTWPSSAHLPAHSGDTDSDNEKNEMRQRNNDTQRTTTKRDNKTMKNKEKHAATTKTTKSNGDTPATTKTQRRHGQRQRKPGKLQTCLDSEFLIIFEQASNGEQIY
jgi:hypothetical protein